MKLINKKIIAKRRFDFNFSIGDGYLFMFLISDKIKRVCISDKEAFFEGFGL